MSSLKKLAVSLAVIAVLLAGCSSSKYTDKIDKAVKMQDKTRKIAKTIQAMKSNILIKRCKYLCFNKGKYVILAYKPLSDDAEVHYYTYEFKGKRHITKKTLIQKVITNRMNLTIKKRI